MLAELRVQNLLLIESAELVLDAGLNVITGETGAGKTMLAHALDLLLGGKPRRGIVRPGADEAYVEGVFAPPPGARRRSRPRGAGRAARRSTAASSCSRAASRRTGRTRAYLQGRSVSAAELRRSGARCSPSSASTSTAS